MILLESIKINKQMLKMFKEFNNKIVGIFKK